MLQHGGAIGVRVQRGADRHGQMAQHAGAQQELAHFGRLMCEHILGKVFGQCLIVAGEALGQCHGIRLVLQRERRQPQTGRPAFAAVVQRDHGVLGHMRQAVAQKAAGFIEAESQLRGADLHQLPACAQSTKAEIGPAAATHDQLAAARQTFDQLAQQTEHARTAQRVELVHEEGETARVRGDAVHRFHGAVGQGAADAGLHHHLAQIVDEAGHVVVLRIQREPRDGLAACFQSAVVLHHRRALAEARRRAHQNHARRASVVHARRLSLHLIGRGCGRRELGAKAWDRSGGHGARECLYGMAVTAVYGIKCGAQ